MVTRDSGSAIEWALLTSCHFGADVEISVDTTENNVLRDHYTVHGWTIEGARTKKVPLAIKSPCSESSVRVVASYHYMNLGDKQSTERTIAFDPTDNCGA